LMQDPQRDVLVKRRRQFVMEGHTGPHHPITIPDPTPDFWGYRSRCCAKDAAVDSAEPPVPPHRRQQEGGEEELVLAQETSNSSAPAPPPYTPPACTDPQWLLV
jgi:hypothetical protein